MPEPDEGPDLPLPEIGGCWLRQPDGGLIPDPTEPWPPGLPPEPQEPQPE